MEKELRCGLGLIWIMRIRGIRINYLPVKDTIKIVDEDQMGVDTPDRSRLWQVQTPQSFNRELLLRHLELCGIA